MPIITIESKSYTVDIPDKFTSQEECETASSDMFDMIMLMQADHNNNEKLIRNELNKINKVYNGLDLNTHENEEKEKVADSDSSSGIPDEPIEPIEPIKKTKTKTVKKPKTVKKVVKKVAKKTPPKKKTTIKPNIDESSD
jgi:hypothetical protein